MNGSYRNESMFAVKPQLLLIVISGTFHLAVPMIKVCCVY